jgi:hypothetical protein
MEAASEWSFLRRRRKASKRARTISAANGSIARVVLLRPSLPPQSFKGPLGVRLVVNPRFLRSRDCLSRHLSY